MIVKQLFEWCILWQVYLSKSGPRPSWKMYDTLLLDILKDQHILLSGNIFLKSNGVRSQSCNVKSYSATLKAHITSSADTLLRNGASKEHDGWGKAFDKVVEENVFCLLFYPKRIFDTSLCCLMTECCVNVWNPWVEYFKSQLKREHLA